MADQARTDFIITKKLKASLEALARNFDAVVKAQVYLSDREDVPGFNEVWRHHFNTSPATTIIATASPRPLHLGFADRDQHDFACDEGKTKREVIRGPEPAPFDGWVSAVKCGDLLSFPADGSRKGPSDRGGERRPTPAVLRSSSEGRVAFHPATGGGVCRAAGISIHNAVRIQQFHTDLADLPAALEVWDETMDHAPLPLSSIEVAWLPVAGARVMVDLWVPCLAGVKADRSVRQRASLCRDKDQDSSADERCSCGLLIRQGLTLRPSKTVSTCYFQPKNPAFAD